MSKLATSKNPSDSRTLAAALDAYLHGKMMDMEGMLPAQIVSFDRVNNVATVQPLIQWVDTSGNPYSRAQYTQINVLSLGGGGFHISFPLKDGDLGWIFASDRDLSLYRQSLQNTPPSHGVTHKFESGLFIPDVMRNYTLSSTAANAMVIESTDGSTSIAIAEGTITIVAPSNVLVTTPKAKFSQDVEIGGNLLVDGNSTTTGLQSANGGFTAQGNGSSECVLPATTTIGGITVSGHGHEQDGTSGRTSGGMIS